MKDIYSRFSSKASLSPQSVIFLYDGKNVSDVESSFGELTNNFDKIRNKMNALITIIISFSII